jgi:uncharacterized membrane protein YsdA (DUF1294 family)
MKLMNYLVIGYFGLLNLVGFLAMGNDKQKAKRNAWRIPERTLLLIAFLGGGLGSLVGMYTFHHKTKHTKFIILVPLATFTSLLALYKLLSLM